MAVGTGLAAGAVFCATGAACAVCVVGTGCTFCTGGVLGTVVVVGAAVSVGATACCTTGVTFVASTCVSSLQFPAAFASAKMAFARLSSPVTFTVISIVMSS